MMRSVPVTLALTCTGCYVGAHARAAVNPAWGDVKSTGGVTFDGGGMMQWERTKYLTLGLFGEASLFPGTGRANGAGGAPRGSSCGASLTTVAVDDSRFGSRNCMSAMHSRPTLPSMLVDMRSSRDTSVTVGGVTTTR